jgi:UDP-N-acetyl-D-galactosamine dehydrogenase
MKLSQAKVAIIGLGYVGLPLAIQFSKKIKIIGFDINKQRINELKKNYDRTLEVSSKNIKLAKKNKIYS